MGQDITFCCNMILPHIDFSLIKTVRATSVQQI